jgi:hypothetical protein
MSTLTDARAPIRRVPWTAGPRDQPWPAATHVLLLLAGVVLALTTFATVLNMPDLPYHPARDLELKATYDAYRDTGVPLVKENGSGSWYGQVAGEGMAKAAGDDDPGSYLVASWMSHLTGSASPYPGLIAVMAVLSALPWLLLPVTMARIFGRARAGFAMLGLPLLAWFVNDSLLVGTEYGQSDLVSPVRVYALYGLPSAVIFLSLVLVAWALTRRLTWRTALAMSVLLLGLAVAGNLLRSMSGFSVAALVGVLWWAALRGRGRWVALGAGVVTASVGIVLASWVPGLVVNQIDEKRAQVISAEASQLPDAHGTWHPLYLGLSYPQPITGEASDFGVVWSDEFGWEKAREVDPDVVVASTEYDEIIKNFFLDAVRARPWDAFGLYVDKLAYTARHFAAMLIFVGFAGLLVWRRRTRGGGDAARTAAITLPAIALGLVPPVLVMPMLYYYSELVAGLGLLLALALAGAVCALTGLPRDEAASADLDGPS